MECISNLNKLHINVMANFTGSDLVFIKGKEGCTDDLNTLLASRQIIIWSSRIIGLELIDSFCL